MINNNNTSFIKFKLNTTESSVKDNQKKQENNNNSLEKNSTNQKDSGDSFTLQTPQKALIFVFDIFDFNSFNLTIALRPFMLY